MVIFYLGGFYIWFMWFHVWFIFVKSSHTLSYTENVVRRFSHMKILNILQSWKHFDNSNQFFLLPSRWPVHDHRVCLPWQPTRLPPFQATSRFRRLRETNESNLECRRKTSHIQRSHFLFISNCQGHGLPSLQKGMYCLLYVLCSPSMHIASFSSGW